MSLTNRSDARQKRGRNYVCNGVSSDRGTLKRRLSDLHDIDGAISAWETRDSLNGVDGLEPLLDAFFSVVPREEDEIAWKKFGFDLCNLALKIVKAVENTNDFQSHFCKLLPTVGVICSRCSGAWRLVLRPLLNIFTNKKMDFAHLKSSVKELKTISKYAESGEMTKFARENLHLLQAFFKLALRSGDFLLQMDILEIVFIWAVGDKKLAEAVLSPANRTIRQLLETLNFLDFEKDSRVFLNAVNASLAACKRVFSINCNLVYFGNLSLTAPLGMDGIWVDVNRDSRRITIFCSDFNANSDGGQRVMLQLPLSGIEKLKLEFGEVSGGECYCITVKIRSLPDMYEFAKGRTMVCAAPSAKNPRDAVTDFVRVVDELSAETREKPQEGKKFRPEKTGYTDMSKCQSEKRKPSCTSPVNITIDSNEKSGGKRKRKWNRMSRTSPLILPKQSKERMRIHPGKTVRDETNRKSTFLLQSIHLQVHQFSSSAIEMPSSSLSNNTDGLSERTVKLKSNELSNQSTPKVERQRLPQDTFHDREEARHEKGQQEESPEEYRRRKDLTTVARICEDFILTDEFEAEESGNVDAETPKRDTRPTGGRRRANREKAREKSCLSAKRKPPAAEERRNTSLLDPNGYAYRRWLRPTTSERSNFWLNKLRDPHITVSKPETDVFQFTEEGGLSDDSNLFLKDKAAKERKLCRSSSGRVRRRQENQKTRAEITGRRTETRTTGSNSETMVKPKGRARESETEVLPFGSRIRKGTHKSGIAPRDQVTDYCQPDTPTQNEKSKKGESSGGGKTVSALAARQKISSTSKIRCSSAPREVQNKGTPTTKCLKELDDIARSLSSGFEKLLREIGEREVRHARKYAEEIDARMKALTEEEEEELSNRPTRFDLCIQYFFHGCSALGSNGDLQAEMEKRVETVANSNGRERYLQEKVSGFVGRLREMVAEEAEANFHKHMKTARIHQFQQILSYNVSKGFHSRSQHFF